MWRETLDILKPSQVDPIESRLTRGSSGLAYYQYLPRQPNPDLPPFVSVHGISRNAHEHMAAFGGLAERSGRLLIAPVFDDDRFKGYQRLAADSGLAETAFLSMLNEKLSATGISTEKIVLFGYSAGAQFAHRFAMLHPNNVSQLILASSGWYTFPTENARYPYGISRRTRMGRRANGGMGELFRLPILLLVGDRDLERDSNLRQNAEVDIRQGLTRVERARRWQLAVEAVALRCGTTANIAFEMLPGCGHEFTECVNRGELSARIENWLEERSGCGEPSMS